MARETFLLSADEGDGITEWFHYDHDTGEEVIEHVQDATPILEFAQRMRNETDERAPIFRGKELVQVGAIPLSLYYKLPEEVRMDQNALTKWLNHPDQKVFFFKNGLKL